MRARVSDYAEYYAVRGAVAGLRALGWSGATRAGELIGRLGYSIVRIRRNVAERQIAFAFPNLPDAGVRRIAREAYHHLGRTIAETTLLRYRSREFVLGMAADVHGWEIVEEALSHGRGMLLATGHIGNWELAGSYLAARGLKFGAIARRMGNPLFDRYLNETRAGLGMKIIYEADAVREAPRHLRAGGTLALLADQGVLGLASTFVPFFGRLARTPKGPAVLAIRLNTPLIFGVSLRQPDGRFRFAFERLTLPDSGDRQRDVERMVAAYTMALERWIRRAPEQYFWMHRRWRRQPPGTPPLEDDQL